VLVKGRVANLVLSAPPVKLTQDRRNDLSLNIVVLAVEQLILPMRDHPGNRLGSLRHKRSINAWQHIDSGGFLPPILFCF
jgi:hypothetical protein